MIKINRKLIILTLLILIIYISIANVSADSSFSDVQDKIDTATSGDDIYLDNTTYVSNGNAITIDKDLRIHGGSVSNPNKKSTLDAKK
ncbi:hypothetical protein [Methanobrevibacter oralis]|nr:hypothetical protein [Methanobrevibacter oralis]